MKKILALLSAMLFSLVAFAQTDLSEADKMLFEKAIEYSDNGQEDKAVAIYDQLIKKYPGNWDLNYEKAYCYSALEDYQRALDAILAIPNIEETSPIVYSMMGTSYEGLGDWQKAIKAYDDGLKVFPESGKLHFDKAITYGGQDMLDDMLIEFMNSVATEEPYLSGYYYLAQLLCPSDEAGIGILYGIYHILLDPGSERSHELSDLIYSSYNDHILLGEDGKVEVHLTTQESLVQDEDGTMIVPFEYRLQKYHEWDQNEKILKKNGYFSIADLTALRKHFYEVCFDGGKNEDMKDNLLVYEKSVLDAGHWDAYNMWLFGYGNPDEHNEWIEKNEERFDAFVNWISTHMFMDEESE